MSDFVKTYSLNVQLPCRESSSDKWLEFFCSVSPLLLKGKLLEIVEEDTFSLDEESYYHVLFRSLH